jgi:hypothetical protein
VNDTPEIKMPGKRRMAALAGALLVGAAMAPAPAAACPNLYRQLGCPPPYNGVPVSFGYGLCYRQELLPTPWGPRWIMVNRCP